MQHSLFVTVNGMLLFVDVNGMTYKLNSANSPIQRFLHERTQPNC